MHLLFHIFNLNSDISVLTCGLTDLPPVLVFVTGLLHEQLSVIKLKINHVLPEDVVVANL